MYRVLMPDGKIIELQDLSQFVGILENITISQGVVLLHARVDAEGYLIVIDGPGPVVPAPNSGVGSQPKN